MMSEMKPAGGEFSMMEHRSVALAYYFAGILGVGGNAIIISILWREKAISGIRARMHIQFALANIMVVIGSFFSGTSSFFGRWLFGLAGCQLYGLETYTGGMAAVTLGTALCYQRRLAQESAEKYDKSGWSKFLCCLCWLYSLTVAAGPLVGWNSYVLESAGTACGLNWHQDDWSHNSMFVVLPIVNVLTLVPGIWCLKSAFFSEKAEKAYSSDWFTNQQLNWIVATNIIINSLGFIPYFYLAVWARLNHGTDMTMLASVIPPLSAKLATAFYPLVYCIASARFRQAFYVALFGADVSVKKKD